MSTDSRVFVIQVETIRKHDNADSLSIVDVFGGYPCIIRTDDFSLGDLAAYIPVDMLVPDTAIFAFLRSPKAKAGEPTRIKAKRLRGVFSMGILINAPENVKVGDDVTDVLGIIKWEPEEVSNRGPSRPGGKFLPGDAENDPGFLPAYTDIENLRKWKACLADTEVVVTEKIHGANAGFVWHAKPGSEARLWLRSRRQFKKPNGGGIWADVAQKYQFAEVLQAVCPSVAIFGEVYGQVQDLQYGVGGVDLVAFDAFDLSTMRYLSYDDFVKLIQRLNQALFNLLIDAPDCPQLTTISLASWSGPQLRIAPLLYRGAFDYALIAALAEGATVLGSSLHVREGVVVKPTQESWDPRLGRVILKLAGEGYLTR